MIRFPFILIGLIAMDLRYVVSEYVSLSINSLLCIPMLQCVAVCCSALQCIADGCRVSPSLLWTSSMLLREQVSFHIDRVHCYGTLSRQSSLLQDFKCVLIE